MVFGLFRRRSSYEEAAHALYSTLVRQARQPAFYERAGVPDTVEGRFDLLALHAFLVMRRLRAEGDALEDLSQALFDLMFADIDQNLRELGVGDLMIGSRVKKMARLFYGRIRAYDDGLEAEGDAVLIDALDRNLYRGVPADRVALEQVARYIRREAEALAVQPAEALARGEVAFGSFVPAEDGETT